MPLTIGEDSYVTLNQANNYAGGGPAAGPWSGLPDTSPDGKSKEAYLREAYRVLRAWPGTDLPPTTGDLFLQEAQIELAVWLIKNYEDFSSQFGSPMGLGSITMGDLNMRFMQAGLTLPSRVAWCLKNYSVLNSFVRLRTH